MFMSIGFSQISITSTTGICTRSNILRVGADQLFLLLDQTFCSSQQDLITCLWQDGIEAFKERNVDRMVQGRNDNRNKPGSAGSKSAGDPVADITEFVDRFQYAAAKAHRHHFRRAEH